MNTLIVLSLVLPFCLTIEVKYNNLYGNGIRKVEIPSCDSEPCPFVKGEPLNISITVESNYPKEQQFKTVSDLESNVGIHGYRNRYVYPLAESQLYCKQQQPNDCPLCFDNLYTIKRQLFLSKDTEADIHSGFGSRNGKHYVEVSVVMMAHGNVGTVIGTGNFALDIKAN